MLHFRQRMPPNIFVLLLQRSSVLPANTEDSRRDVVKNTLDDLAKQWKALTALEATAATNADCRDDMNSLTLWCDEYVMQIFIRLYEAGFS